jgi:uncharacterized protein
MRKMDMELFKIFKTLKPLIGMVHLSPLPGSPKFCGDFSKVLSLAVNDAKTLAAAGFDGIIVENFGDIPFYPDRIPVETVTFMTRIITEIQHQTSLPIGVNVLRNDAISALAIAKAVDAKFIRTNVHIGVTTSEQGWLTGRAHNVARYNKQLCNDVAVFADVAVKHSYPFVTINIKNQIVDAVERSMADAIIVSGDRTGKGPEFVQVEEAKKTCSDLNVPLLVGSGVNFDNVKELLKIADGAIIGSALKLKNVTNPIDFQLAQRMVESVRKIRGQDGIKSL